MEQDSKRVFGEYKTIFKMLKWGKQDIDISQGIKYM